MKGDPMSSFQRRQGGTWLLVAALISACGSPDSLPPNLLLITTDRLSAHDLSCFGETTGPGAEICSLEASGAQSSWAPGPDLEVASSMASILTSLDPDEHRVGASPASFLPSEIDSLPELLQRTGYATAAVVSSPVLNRSRNLQQGFDLFRDRPSDHNTGPLSPRATTDAALGWVRRARPPWFLWVHYRARLPILDREVSQLVRELDGLGVDPGVLFTATLPGPGPHPPTAIAVDRSALDQEVVPLLWRAPDKRPIPPKQRAARARGVDVAPTLLRAARIPIPNGFRGRPLFITSPRDPTLRSADEN
jgi:arylsulfatase A-like enzyme